MAVASAESSVATSSVRSVYLVTYSRADLEKLPNRSCFAKAVVDSFQAGSAKVKHWCCSREKHADGGEHYHMAIKLEKPTRWSQSKKFLVENLAIQVNYSSFHYNYYSAWRYVTKQDRSYEESEGHPDLRNYNGPQTSKASIAKVQSGSGEKCSAVKQGKPNKRAKQEKKKRFTAFDLSEVILQKNIKTLTELHAYAHEQRETGKTDVVQFILCKSPKTIQDLLDTTWRMKNAKAVLERNKKSRIQLFHEASTQDCRTGCNGLWLQCANEILDNNGMDKRKFGQAVLDLLTSGRGKHRNIMIVGPANCGKTFILKPLTLLYQTFLNPASGTFAWVGVEEAECIFLNDFRWSATLIPWHDLLLMLEGEVVHLPAPKTHFTRDIELVKDTPIFCTSKRPLIFIKNGVVDDRETEMMAVRWNIISFNFQIPQHRQRNIPACVRCFTNLLSGNLGNTSI